jgi:ribosomal protein L24E
MGNRHSIPTTNSLSAQVRQPAEQLAAADGPPTDPALAGVLAMACFACGRPYLRGDGRFCSPKCRLAFDGGFMAGDIVAKPRDGVPLICCGCNRAFVSKGLRCCSAACERRLHEKAANAAVLAEVGMEVPAKRKCRECGRDIARWTGIGKQRRQVPRSVLFCSPRCRRNARKAGWGQNPELVGEGPQKPLCHSALLEGADHAPAA